jgi:glycosyltransferase involved in cell wall biosynthesis
MRVGFVVQGSLDTATGGYLYDRRLVRHLRSHGDTVEVVELPRRGYARHLADNASPSFLRRVAGTDFDVILEDELGHPSLIVANRRLRARCPIVTVVHLLRTSERSASPLRPLYAAVERRYLAGIDGALFNSHATRAAANQLVGRTVPGVVAHPGGDHVAAAPPPEPERPRPGPLRILTLANVVPGKGVHHVLDAVALLPAGSWRLTVVGSVTTDPAYAERVRRQIGEAGIEDHVELVGEVPDTGVPRHLVANDVMMLPSSYEAAGIAYLEAMRFGLPVIASSAGGAPELVTHEREGFLVQPGDVTAMAGSLQRWISEPELVATMGQAARLRADRHPTWEQSFAPVRPFLNSLVESRAAVRREPAT